ncbi:MAG: ROK family protein [Planctomycetes bacterium]|nr:ROK family protein [Planctomycetota bacterium]
MSHPYWIGVDLGGTKILSGIFDSNFKLLAKSKQATNSAEGGEAVFGRLIQTVETIIAESKVDPSKIAGMGLAIPGQIVPGGRLVRYAPNLGWRDYDLTQLIPKNWKWPVHIENDVRMGTYGEWALGAAKGAKHVFGVFVGTGVGGGLILDSKLYNGFNGHAGEVGHIIVHWRNGSELEAIAGRRAMMVRAKELLDDAPKRVRKEWKDVDLSAIKSSQLAKYYSKDDPLAVQLVDDAARALGAAIGSVINLLSPEIVVIGGGVAGALGESFRERSWEIAQRYALPRAAENVRCVAAALGDDSGIVGAAVFAKDRTTA